MHRVLVIIPCYNEEKNIEKVVSNIKDFIDNSPRTRFSLDYIIVNDCSNDNTLEVCVANGYNYLNLPINLGIGGCVQAGYRFAFENEYDIAIQHDGDGQHDPSFFSDVIAPIASDEADVTIGSRFIDKQGFQSTGLRRFGIAVLRAIIRLCTKVKILDVTSGYRAANKRFIELFANQYAQDYPEPESIVDAVSNGARIIEVPVVMHTRKLGKSSIGAFKSLHYMIKVSLSILLHRLIIPRG